MRSWLENEWQRRGGGALIFLPFSLLFWLVTAIRRALYRLGVLPKWRAPVPVIVVGNITVGGTGKTPLVLALVELLAERGWRPGVIARGYGRLARAEHDPLGVVRVYPDVATPEHFGDEPVLIARRANVPVYVSPDRPAAARALLQTHPEVDVLVSDDGLQHYALARDLELAVVDGERLFGNALLLPSGPLREPIGRLRKVDAVVVNGPEGVKLPAAAIRGDGTQQRFTMRLARERFVALSGDRQLNPEEFAIAARGRNVVAIAGIGNPARFFEQLAALGVAARSQAFDDHFTYQASDLKFPGADVIVMTEKDAVKCAAFADARMWFMRVDAILPPGFDEFVLTRLARARRSSHGSQAA
jgi:tetraacyldisaccharide 4'-kinase